MDGRAVVLFVILAVILGGLYLRFRHLQMLHAERMAAMEKGVTIPVWRAEAPWSPRVYLLRGLMWTLGGAALVLATFGIAQATHQPERASWALQEAKGLSENVGIPLDEARHIMEQERLHRVEGMPDAVALLGLIPVGIGLAYLLFYFTGDTRRIPNQAPGDPAETRSLTV